MFPFREYVYMYIIRRKITSQLQTNHFTECGTGWLAITVHITVCAVTSQRSGRLRNFWSNRGRDERAVCSRKRPNWHWCPRRHLFNRYRSPSPGNERGNSKENQKYTMRDFMGTDAISTKSSFFWNITQPCLATIYGRFVTTYRSHLQGSNSSRNLLDLLDLWRGER